MINYKECWGKKQNQKKKVEKGGDSPQTCPKFQVIDSKGQTLG